MSYKHHIPRICAIFIATLVFLSLCLAGCTSTSEPLSGKETLTTVTRVVDGDTMQVSLNGAKETIRLLLVDTPETVHPEKSVQPFGPEASQFAKNMLTGKEVRLEMDVSERDKYGRLLCYLWIGDRMFNEMLLEKGLARVAYIYPPNVKYVDQFQEIQKKAQQNGLGIWSIENYTQLDGFHPDKQQTVQRNPQKSDSGERNLGKSSNGQGLPVLSNDTAEIEIVSLSTPVHPGDKATLKVKTLPGKTVSIAVQYKSGPSQAKGLEQKQSDQDGLVAWTWNIGSNTAPGKWPIELTTDGLKKQTWIEVAP